VIILYLLTAEEMQRLDSTAINEIGIPGVVLMENAGLQVVEVIYRIIGDPRGKKVIVFSGKGNNGGDGFVIARHLLNSGAEVKVLLFADVKDITGDAKVNLDILHAMGQKVISIVNPNSINIAKFTMAWTDIVVDSIFGTGFKGSVPVHIGNVINIINSSGKPVVSVDIPSGLEANTGRVNGPCIRADNTVTFAYAKLGLVINQGLEYVGDLTVADISIPPGLIEQQGINRYFITPEIIKGLIPLRRSESHKGTYGRVLVIGGSPGMSGAAAMAAEAALKAGAGLVTLGVPAGLNNIMEVKLTEVMIKPLPQTDNVCIGMEALPVVRSMMEGMDVLALGPGLSTDEGTKEFVLSLVSQMYKPVVIDADALNILASSPDILSTCQAPLVLTPHPGEMARLLGTTIDQVQENRIETAVKAARAWNKVVVLKGARTVIAGPDGAVYINVTGNPGMATGGSGDVLTGIIAGLIGQGMIPLEAAVAGVYFHGLAGDMAAAEKGMMSLVAGDILEFLHLATKSYSQW
jgi:hydroxyethylthiazole kinase-like uncharacterized protein yjeF